MKPPQELLVERTNRIQSAIALQKTDRVPVVLSSDAFCAKHLNVRLSEFVNNPDLACKTMIKSLFYPSLMMGEKKCSGIQPLTF